MRVPNLFPSAEPPKPRMDTAGRRLLVDRALATSVDLALCYAVFVSPLVYVALVASPAFGAMGWNAVLLSLGALVPVNLTYGFLFEWRYSRTPGKVLLSLMVVTTAGEPCTARGSAIRNLFRYVDGLGLPPAMYLVGFLAALFSSTGQRIGDRAGGTVVVRSSK